MRLCYGQDGAEHQAQELVRPDQVQSEGRRDQGTPTDEEGAVKPRAPPLESAGLAVEAPGRTDSHAVSRGRRDCGDLRCLLLPAEHPHSVCARARARVPAHANHRPAELPALPVPDGDAAWFLPPMDQPHFIGEYVWLTRDGAVKFASIIEL